MTDKNPFSLLLGWTHTILIFMWVGCIASLLGWPALGFLTPFFLILFFGQLIWKGRSLISPLWLGCLAFGWLLAGHWLAPLWSLPSNDDTINHLGLLQSILKSGHFLIGKISKPGVEYLGHAPYHFYPSGTHVLIDFFQPMQAMLATTMKAVVWGIITLYPLTLVASGMQWLGDRKLTPWVAFAAAACVTQAVFPLSALGEGGMSRIVTLVLFVPLWFHWISQPTSIRTGIFYGAIASPMLLFLHPSVLPFIGLALLLFKGRTRLAALVSLPVGVVLFYLLIKSAPQEVLKPELMKSLVEGLPGGLQGWFERLKSPFHYWFSDPDGYLKFLSPKNIFVYGAIVLAVRGRIPRWTLLLVTIPFAVAATAMTDSSILHQLGLIYYHSTKRVSELTPFLGFTLAMFFIRYYADSEWLHKKWMRGLVVPALILSFFAVFWDKSTNRLNGFNTLYHSLTLTDAQAIREHITPLLPKDGRVIRMEHQRFEFLRYEITPEYKIFTIRPECQEVGVPSDFCVRKLRQDWPGVTSATFVVQSDQRDRYPGVKWTQGNIQGIDYWIGSRP